MNLNNSGSVYDPYRWCIVPQCMNSSIKTPQKLWIRVPTDLDMRRTWLKLAGRDRKILLKSKSHVYFCEDHFDLENDMKNYQQYKAKGSIKRIWMKPNCVPTRFECQTNRGTSTLSELNEPQFGVSTPNSQSVVSLEQSTMSNLLSPMKTEDYGQHEDVMDTAPIPTLFCICCLKREVPVVSLLTCSHADFLNNLMIPEIKPESQVICYQCHEQLRKIKLFKLQVEESFKLLSDIRTENTPKSSNQRHHLEIRQVFNIDIPQTDFNNIENPQTILEDANTDLDDIIKEEKDLFDDIYIEKSLPTNSLQTKDDITKEENDLFDDIEKSHPTNSLQAKDDLIKEEKDLFDDIEKSVPTNSLQAKKMKNIEEAIRIINSNQNSDCINFLATSLQSLSHSLISDIYTNFEIGSQIDTNPTEIIITVNTAPSTNNIAEANSTENDTNNKNLNSKENSEIINEETINRMVNENADVVKNVANDELNRPVTKGDNSMDIGESNNMQMDETPMHRQAKRPLLGSNIKQLTLTREQLIEEREKIATSQSYLRSPHRCESCLIGFQFQENLEDHVKRKHTPGKRNTIECDVCLQYVDCGARKMHMFWHHTRFECVTCAEKFASYDKAAIHYRKNHPKIRSRVLFKCPHCPYKTGRKSYFTDHLNAYTKCKLCGVMLGCATGIKLKIHMRNCVGAKLKTAKLKTIKISEES